MISCIIESRVPFLISLFNFQGPIAFPLSRTAQRVYHTLFSLSILFWKFFRFFWNLFSFILYWLFSLCSGISPWELVYIITSIRFCQHFLQTFLCIFDYIFAFIYAVPGVFVFTGDSNTTCCASLSFSLVLSIWGITKSRIDCVSL